MSIKSQGHSLILVKGHSDFKVKCLTFGLYTQVSDSGPQGPLVVVGGRSHVEGHCLSVCLFDCRSVDLRLERLGRGRPNEGCRNKNLRCMI